MSNYKLLPARIPANPAEAQAFEQWLNTCLASGADLICFAPTLSPNTMLAVFRVGASVAVAEQSPWTP